MSFSLEQLLNQQQTQQLSTVKKNYVGTQAYAVTLGYEKHPNGQPIYTRICKVRIEGLNTTYFKEDEVRPYSRRDKLLAHQSYWDKPLFKVFYRKLLDEIPRRSVFYFENETDLKGWEHACKKLGINNAYVLKLKSQK
ncbi:hypothetical protein ABFY60_27495 [Lysinibacillus pakistanensis]|uniref:hypothetical protein n=1 Tax=Lysinibacillus pakistanensis TaxID=759811 RepID=UPI003D28B057